MGLKMVSTGLRKTKKFTGRKTPYVSKNLNINDNREYLAA